MATVGSTILANSSNVRNDSWTRVKLHVALKGDRWEILGKAWPVGEPEPSSWLISHLSSRTPFSGRASIWGIPYSGKPIRFDDLAVELALSGR